MLILTIHPSEEQSLSIGLSIYSGQLLIAVPYQNPAQSVESFETAHFCTDGVTYL